VAEPGGSLVTTQDPPRPQRGGIGLYDRARTGRGLQRRQLIEVELAGERTTVISGAVTGRLAAATALGLWVAGQEQLTAGYRSRYFGEVIASRECQAATSSAPFGEYGS
jgi:hypothetical protein